MSAGARRTSVSLIKAEQSQCLSKYFGKTQYNCEGWLIVMWCAWCWRTVNMTKFQACLYCNWCCIVETLKCPERKMSAEPSRSPYLHLPSVPGRQSVSPKLGSGRVKSPLPAPAAYRASCMSAAAKRYKVTTATLSGGTNQCHGLVNYNCNQWWLNTWLG